MGEGRVNAATYDPRIHHRRSIRLKGHDYAGGGVYFVTICAHREFIGWAGAIHLAEGRNAFRPLPGRHASRVLLGRHACRPYGR